MKRLILLTICCSALLPGCRKKAEEAPPAEKKLVLDILWTRNYDQPILAAPIPADNRLYICGTEGLVAAVDAYNGETLWETVLEEDGFEGKPLYLDGSLYLGSLEGSVLIMDADNGTVLNEAGGLGSLRGGLVQHNGQLYAGSYNNSLYALDSVTLEMLWHYEADNYINGSPVLSPAGTLVIGDCSGAVTFLRADDGDLLFKGSSASYIPSSPVFIQEDLIYADYDGNLRMLDKKYEEIWNTATDAAPCTVSPVLSGNKVFVAGQKGLVKAYSLSDGTPVWEYQTGGNIETEPLLIPWGLAVLSTGTLSILNPDNGEVLVRVPIVGVAGNGVSWADNILYFATDDGTLAAVQGSYQ